IVRLFGVVLTMASVLVVSHAASANDVCRDIQTFGGKGDGVADNANALTRAYSAMSNVGGCISFPSGNYYFGSHVSYTLGANQGVELVGSGPRSTVLTGTGLEFIFTSANNSVTIRDMV